MKYTKIFWGNQYVSQFQVGRSSIIHRVKFYFKKYTLISAGICVLGWIFVFGMFYGKSHPNTVYADREVIKEVKSKSPVMERIAMCESNSKHINPKTGQVYMLANTNGTTDVGKYMINTVWHKKATELGYDITKEEDNEKMAYWIYENRGTGDWYASSDCWSK